MMKRKKSPQLQHVQSEGSGTPKTSSSGSVTTSTPSTLHPHHHGTNYANMSTLTVTPHPHIKIHGSMDDLHFLEEVVNDGRASSCSLPSLGSTEGIHGSSFDEREGTARTPDMHRTKAAIEHIQLKIAHTKELIKAEQTTRDDNVNEYLKLATNADKLQLQRIKNVFEKKNQKSAQTIGQLQKKMDNYNKKIRDLEIHGLRRGVLRDMGQGLKDVGTNIKGGISGLSVGVVGNLKGLSHATHTAAESMMSKPREFAHLIKNKFGSADNINSISKHEDHGDDPEHNVHGSALSTHSARYTSEEDSSSITSESGQAAHQPSIPPASPRHHIVSHSLPTNYDPSHVIGGQISLDLEPILQELRAQREEYQHLVDEMETVKTQIQSEVAFFSQALQEERYRCERIEEQMNDLIELHQNEIENLKQGIADMEEKVQYQSEERLRDVHDVLDSCQTRISRMEHQQHQHLQQLVSLDNFENSQARALLLKLINVLLTVLQVVLLLVATLSNIIMPFLKTRVRTLTTCFILLTVVLVCHQWPDLIEYYKNKSRGYLGSWFKFEL